MKRKLLIVIGVVTLVALAGCSSILESTDNGTPTDIVNETPEGTFNPTETTESDSTPNVNATGNLNASNVLTEHRNALMESESYTAQIRQQTVQQGTNSLTQDVERYHRINLSQGVEYTQVNVRRSTSQQQPVTQTSQVYIDENKTYQSQTALNNTRYAVQNTSQNVSIDSTSQSQVLSVFVSSMEYTETETVEVNGTTATRYDFEQVTDMQRLTQTQNQTFQNINSSIVIQDNGLVRQFVFSGELEGQQNSLTVSISTAYDRIGEVSIEEPEWLEEANNASTKTLDRQPDSG